MKGQMLMDDIYTETLYKIAPRVTIALGSAWSDIPVVEKELLTKITEALRQRINPKLGLHSFRIVHVPSFDLSTWREKPEKLIFFGPAVKGFTLYEVVSAGTTKIVFADSLADLIPNDANRTRLWQALKHLFS